MLDISKDKSVGKWKVEFIADYSMLERRRDITFESLISDPPFF